MLKPRRMRVAKITADSNGLAGFVTGTYKEWFLKNWYKLNLSKEAPLFLTA